MRQVFEYRWAEVSVGEGPDHDLTRLGTDGWDAVGMTVTGEHFGQTYVRILLKREVPATSEELLDVAAYERQQVDAAR